MDDDWNIPLPFADDSFLHAPPALPDAPPPPPQPSPAPEAPPKRVKLTSKDPFARDVLRKLKDRKHKLHSHAEYLRVDEHDPRRLWCLACGGSFGTRSTTWKHHVKCESHATRVNELINKRKKEEEDRVAALEGRKAGQLSMFDTVSMFNYASQKRKEEKEVEERRRTLDAKVQAHRLRILKALDERGIPLSVLDGDFLELLQEERSLRLSLGDPSNLRREFGGALLQAHHHRLQDAHSVDGALACLTLDAASHGHAEVLYGVSRIVSPAFAISHHLVIASRFDRPLKSEEYVRAAREAQELLHLRSWPLGNSDGCSTMVKYVDVMKTFYAGYTHVLCISHLVQKIPSKWKFGGLPKLLAAWNLVFKNSLAARALFTSVVKARWVRKHKIRWNSTSAQIHQIGTNWGKIPQVVGLIKEAKLCKDSLKELVVHAGIPLGTTDAEIRAYNFSQTAFEVAAWMDMAPQVVQLTTFAEGAAFELPFVWSKILEIKYVFQQVLSSREIPARWMPNLFSLISSCRERGGVVPAGLWANIQSVLRLGNDYLGECLGGHNVDPDEGMRYSETVAMLKIAQSAHPAIWMRFLMDASHDRNFLWSSLLDNEVIINMFGVTLVQELKNDHGALLALYNSLGIPIPMMDPKELCVFWRNEQHRAAAKSWAKAAQVFCALLPNSVLCERAGSVIRARIDERSEAQMSDETFFCAATAAFAYAEARNEK